MMDCVSINQEISVSGMKSPVYILITPSGVDREDLTPEDICVMDSHLNVIENEHDLKPSSEVLMHIYAYKSRNDIKAVVQTHSRFATAFAVLKNRYRQ